MVETRPGLLARERLKMCQGMMVRISPGGRERIKETGRGIK